MSFIRFVIPEKDTDSGRRIGLFTAMYNLVEDGRLSQHDADHWSQLERWFGRHLKKPKSFSRSSKPHAMNVAISWFKSSAGEHISRMRDVAWILAQHDIHVEMNQTDRPGYIVYEDEFQVAAEPFSETAT